MNSSHSLSYSNTIHSRRKPHTPTSSSRPQQRHHQFRRLHQLLRQLTLMQIDKCSINVRSRTSRTRHSIHNLQSRSSHNAHKRRIINLPPTTISNRPRPKTNRPQTMSRNRQPLRNTNTRRHPTTIQTTHKCLNLHQISSVPTLRMHRQLQSRQSTIQSQHQFLRIRMPIPTIHTQLHLHNHSLISRPNNSHPLRLQQPTAPTNKQSNRPNHSSSPIQLSHTTPTTRIHNMLTQPFQPSHRRQAAHTKIRQPRMHQYRHHSPHTSSPSIHHVSHNNTICHRRNHTRLNTSPSQPKPTSLSISSRQ